MVAEAPEVSHLSASELAGPISTKGAAPNCEGSLDENGKLHIVGTSDKYNMQFIWLREKYFAVQADRDNNKPSNAVNAMGTPTLDIGESKYLMIKIKTDIQSPIYINLSSTAFTYEHQAADSLGQANIFKGVTIMKGGSADWKVCVIDLDALGERVAAKDGKRVIDTLIISTSNSELGHYIDIEYMAFAKDDAEISTIAGGDEVVKVNY